MNKKLLMITVALVIWLAEPMATAGEAPDQVAVCAGCHGQGGQSLVPENPILAAQHFDYLVSALRAYVSGERDYGIMETLAGRLGDGDIEVIAAYYAAQSPVRSQSRAAGDAARGEARAAPCVACHGPAGHSVIAANPKLAGQHARYLSSSLSAYKSGARNNAVMGAMVAALSEQDIEDIAAYFAAQPPQAAGEAASGGQPQ